MGSPGEDLDHDVIAGFLASPAARLRPDGVAKKPGALNALRCSLKTFARYLHDAGHVARDPARLVPRALCSAGPPKALTPEEQLRLLAALEHAVGAEAARDRVLFGLMLRIGIRLSEALGLNVEDLNLEAGEATVRGGKGDRVERVFLPAVVAAQLRDYLGDRASGPVFLARNGKRVTHRHVQRRFDEWLEKAGIRRRLSPHSLRHTMGHAPIRADRGVLLVKEALRAAT